MCLSNVYKKGEEENIFLFKNIAKVDINGKELVFTDLMGVKNVINGSLIEIDLLENTILVKEETI